MRADKDQITRLLKTSRGQIDGVLKMIDQDKYCVDIVNQIMACDAVLKKAVKEILRAHIGGVFPKLLPKETNQNGKRRLMN